MAQMEMNLTYAGDLYVSRLPLASDEEGVFHCAWNKCQLAHQTKYSQDDSEWPRFGWGCTDLETLGNKNLPPVKDLRDQLVVRKSNHPWLGILRSCVDRSFVISAEDSFYA